ncbi:MAG: hypothetical protein ACK4GM_09970 [Tabrizicola sp.]
MPGGAKVGAAFLLALALTGGCCHAQDVPPPGEQVSADCAAPVYATDRLVCSDAALRELDAHMLQLWRMAEARHRGNGALRDAQIAWFRSRSLCAFGSDHRACVVTAYHKRIAALLALVDAP